MGLITSFTRGTPALTQAFVETAPLIAINSVGAPFAAANEAHYILARVRGNISLTVATATWYVGNATGNVDAGIGTISGTTFTLLSSTGAIAASGTNARQSAALTAAVTLHPGRDYYLAVSVSNVASLTMGRVASGAVGIVGLDTFYKTSEQPLTTGATVAAGANTSVAFPWVRFS